MTDFSGDRLMSVLVAVVLDDRISDRRAIKKLIKNWRADLIRV